MPVINRAADLQDQITEWRRDLHANPELHFEVHRTAGVVTDKLKAFRCDEVVTGVGRSGVAVGASVCFTVGCSFAAFAMASPGCTTRSRNSGYDRNGSKGRPPVGATRTCSRFPSVPLRSSRRRISVLPSMTHGWPAASPLHQA